MARKMYREAIESYEQAPQDSAVVWNKLGIAYHQMMQLDAAMKRYRRAIRLDAKYPEAINNLGTIYYAEKRYGKATGSYKHALKLAPASASIYSNLGTCLLYTSSGRPRKRKAGGLVRRAHWHRAQAQP